VTRLTWIALDLIFLLLLILLVGGPLAAVSALAARLGPHLPSPLFFALVPALAVLFLLLFLCAVGAMRLLLPRLQPGTYPFPGHRQSVAWLFHFALQRIANLPLWSHLILSFATLRWLFLRGLGAQTAFNIHTSVDTVVTDPSLLILGDGVMLGGGSFVAGHFMENDHLFLAPVRLAKGAQVLAGAMLGPGVALGEGSVIGPESRLLTDVVVGEYAHVGMGCVLYTGVRIGANAVIGHQVIIEGDAQVGEGAVVQSGARVPKGSRIADGERFPPRSAEGQ
jgi:acetyltransferase-like isoleucine patch superfamily enzyme